MPTNLLLLPLLGGYWFLHTLYYTRFRSQRLDGYRLLMESAFAGLLLTLAARVVVLFAQRWPLIQSEWSDLAPGIPFLGTTAARLLLGIAAPYVLNVFLDKTGIMSRLDAQTRAIERYGNHLLRLFHSASLQEKTVSVALDNGKVYIGLVAAAPNLEPHDTFLAITPFYSGYRDRATLRLVLTVDYLNVYDQHGLYAEDFRVVVPVASIRMASFFDQAAYPAFIVEAGEPQPESPTRQ
jgi:hypothetical protein